MKSEKPRTKKDNDRGRRRKTAAGRALNEDSRWLRSTNNANNFRIVTTSGTGNWANTQELHAISPGSSRQQSK